MTIMLNHTIVPARDKRAAAQFFARLKDLRLVEAKPVRIGGWAFRGLLNLPVVWTS